MVVTCHMSHDLLSNRIAPNLSNRINDIFAVIGYLFLGQPISNMKNNVSLPDLTNQI